MSEALPLRAPSSLWRQHSLIKLQSHLILLDLAETQRRQYEGPNPGGIHTHIEGIHCTITFFNDNIKFK